MIKRGADGGVVATSIESARKWLKDWRKDAKQKAIDATYPVNTATEKERNTFLCYAASFMKPEQYPFKQRKKVEMCRNLVIAIARGYSLEGIAAAAGVSIETVGLWHKESIEIVKEAIDKAKRDGMPLLGGVQ